MSVANSYARALLEAAKDANTSSEVIDQMESHMDSLVSLIDQSREMRVALIAPVTTLKEKISLVQELATSLKWPSLFREFIVLLLKKKRLVLIKDIRDAFGSVKLTQEGGVSGRLVAAEPIGDADVATLVKAFSQKLGKKVAFRVSTDSSLLAGIKVTVNGVTYDGSLRSQLQKLRDGFVAGLPGANT